MSGEKRLYSLDALKFAASIIIVFHHFHQVFGTGRMGISFYEGSQIYWGHLVELFFILSGIFTGIKNEANQNTTFIVFIKKKLVRLLPMAEISIFVFLVLLVIYYKVTNSWWFGIVPTPWTIMKTCLLIFAGGGFWKML